MTKKYIHIFIYAMLAGFILLHIGNSTTKAKSDTDIVKMIRILQAQKNVQIKDWSVFAREIDHEINSRTLFGKRVRELKALYPDFHWQETKNDSSLSAWGTRKNAQNGTLETIKIMLTLTKPGSTAYMLYDIRGNEWSQETAPFLKGNFYDKLDDIFRGKPSIFTCIQGEVSDKMVKVLSTYVNEMVKAFHATEIESIKEDSFVSISAHSTMFESYLTEEKMNLQVAMRTVGMGGKTAFVVGTPIITTEY
ncbi:YwmB family TATA-box binding protein [Peribacillus sp. SCS-37]|uniref:YwmB family TATA-box binding protein n=1 Tax=Paraperibacillus esterisolvens TaxID=3115296 RepID=UPI0039059A85